MSDQSIEIAKAKNNVLAMVAQAFAAKNTKVPTGYDKELALELAVPVLMRLENKSKQPALLACDIKSVANALYLMCVNGYYVHLSHCAFIVYNSDVTLQTQYQGRIMKARRDWGLKEIVCDVVYKGDTLTIERDEFGHKKYTHVSAPFDQRKTDLDSIVGVWCYLVWNDGTRTAHEMTIAQCKAAWSKGYGTGKTHNEFSEKMVRKSCITSAMTEWGNTNPSVNIESRGEDDEVTYDVTHEDVSQKTAIQSAMNANALPASNAVKVQIPVVEMVKEATDEPTEDDYKEAGF